MKVYWSLQQVPELAALLPAERRTVHRACYKRYGLKSRRGKIALVILGLCVMAGIVIGGILHWVFGFAPSYWHKVIGAAAGGAIGGFVFGQTVTQHLRPYYAEYIRNELSHAKPEIRLEP